MDRFDGGWRRERSQVASWEKINTRPSLTFNILDSVDKS